ncbi:MAG TPA: oligosaccharide flippase family protein [Gemmataceae bacterium]|nr:oligosaccharide flippase family protein [Gemmataceae bacterium]
MSAVADMTPRTGSLGRILALGAFWTLFGAVVSRGLTLVGAVLAGRILGTSGFGEVTMIQSTQGLFGVLAGAGLGLAATKFVAEFRSADPLRASRCVALATSIAVISGAIVAAVLCVCAEPIAIHILNAPHLTLELRIATGLVFFGTINGVQTGAVVGYGDFRIAAILSCIRGAGLCFLLIAGIQFGGVMGGVIALVVTEAIAVVSNHLALQRLFPQQRAVWHDRSAAWIDLKAMCRFSVFSLAGSVCTMAAMWYSNVVLVAQADGYSALGIFNAADRWRQVLLFVPASFSPLILSLLSNLHGNNDAGAYRRLFGVNLWISAAVVIVPSAGLAFFATSAMGLFGAEYRDGWMTLVILSASAIAVVMNNILGQILISQGAVLGRFLLDVLLSAALALVSWWLIPQYHDEGMAIGSLVAYSVTALALIAPAIYFMKQKARGAGGLACTEPASESPAPREDCQ